MSQEEYRNEGRRPAQSRSGHGGRRVAPSHPEGERRSAPRRRKKRLGGWGVLLYVIFVLGISALLAGVGWIWALSRCGWKPTRRVFTAPSMG